MKHVLAGIWLFWAMTGAAQATTVRYAFDISAVSIGFSGVHAASGAAVTEAQYAALLADHHHLADLAGRTGQVVMDLVSLESGAWGASFFDLRCISGLLCEANALGAGARMIRQAGVDADTGHPTETLSNHVFATGYYWSFALDHVSPDLFSGRLDFIDDVRPFGFDTLDGEFFSWSYPVARVALSNGSTRIIPNPLPPAALLLGAGLVPLGLMRRRRL